VQATSTVKQPYIVVRYMEMYMSGLKDYQTATHDVEIDFEIDTGDEFAVILINGNAKNVRKGNFFVLFTFDLKHIKTFQRLCALF